MADDTERLIVQLEARITDFEKRMKKAERTGTQSYTGLRKGSRSATAAMEADMLRSTSAINRALATTSTRIGTFGKAMAAGFAGGVIAAVTTDLVRNVTQSVKAVAELGNEAKRAGLSAQAFQEWSFVAEQNRIGIDQLVDGFKELNLRADEFIATGAGPAAEAFGRLNLDAGKLKRGLEEPSELMLDIIDRLEDMDKAAQIRIADEVFGGSAGERFVELLDQGSGGLRRTIQTAHEVGAVLDDAMIDKADQIDRKFNELSTRVSSFGKSVVVAFADAAFGAGELRDELDKLFPTEAQGRAILGDEVFDALDENREAVADVADDIEGLRRQYLGLADDANQTANALDEAVGMARGWVSEELAQTLADAAGQMRGLAWAFEDGSIDADTFAGELEKVRSNAEDTFAALDDADRVSFEGAISELQRLGSVIAPALNIAMQLGDAIKEAAGMASTLGTGPINGRGRGIPVEIRPGEHAPESSPRPKLPGMNASFGAPDAKTGGGGGGGSSRVSDYAREAEQIREQTAALEAEAAALVAVAASGKDYGNALDYARTKAELLHAAQMDGKEITPELEAGIDALARGYVEAGSAAEIAADKLERMEDAAQTGAEALTDVFMSVLDGSRSAKEAVADLLLEIARIQTMKVLTGLSQRTGGGFIEKLGNLLSFDGGGYTGNAARSGGLDGKGGFLAMLHPRETVTDHTRGQSAGGGTTISYAPTITINGGAEAVAELAKVMAKDKQDFAKNVQGVLRNSGLRGR